VKLIRSAEDQCKPVPKIWTICTSDERVLGVKPYCCGKDTLIEDQGVGQGPNVVLELVAKAGMIEGNHVYCDNFFTSFPLLEQLSDLRNGDILPEQAEQSAHQRRKGA
jgi:hypothetical protein